MLWIILRNSMGDPVAFNENHVISLVPLPGEENRYQLCTTDDDETKLDGPIELLDTLSMVRLVSKTPTQ